MSTVLIVDDEALVRECLSEALRVRGFRTVNAGTTDEALAALAVGGIDAVLLDLRVPGGGGETVLRAAAGTGPGFILMTGLHDRNRILAAISLGVNDFVLKGRFRLDDLEQKLRRVIAARLGQRQVPAGKPPVNEPAATGADKPGSETPSPPAPDPSPAADAAPAEAKPQPPAARPPRSARRGVPSLAKALRKLRDMKPLVSRRQLDDAIAEVSELKAMSPVVADILRITRSQDASIQELSRAVRRDQAVSLKVLQLANSAVYSRGKHVDSVNHAVMNIGVDQIRHVVLNITVIDNLSKGGGGAVDSLAFWEHAIATGLIATQLARARGGGEAEADAAFTAGLLHDVGRLVLAQALPDAYERVMKAARKLRLPLEQVESRMLLANHADVTERLLREWKFDDGLAFPIACHHLNASNIRNSDRDLVRRAQELGLANRLAHAMMLGSSGNDVIYAVEDFTAALRIKPATYQRLLDRVPEETADLRLGMLTGLERNVPPAAERAGKSIRAPFRPLYVSAVDGLDTYRVAAEKLRSDGDGPPTAAVVRFTNVRERVMLTTRLREAEHAAKVDPLPLLLISPKANIDLERGAMKGRRAAHIPAPVTLHRLVGALRHVMAEDDKADAEPADTAAQPDAARRAA